jgi:hypothetical protein
MQPKDFRGPSRRPQSGFEAVASSPMSTCSGPSARISPSAPRARTRGLTGCRRWSFLEHSRHDVALATEAARWCSNGVHDHRMVRVGGTTHCATCGALRGAASVLAADAAPRLYAVHAWPCLPAARTRGRARARPAAVRLRLRSLGLRPSPRQADRSRRAASGADTPSPRCTSAPCAVTGPSCGRARRVDRNHSNVYSLCRLSTHLRRTDQEREAPRAYVHPSPARVRPDRRIRTVDTAPAPWHAQPFHARRAERARSIQPPRVDCSSLRAQACGHSKPRHVGQGGLVEMRLADQLREQRDQQFRWADGRRQLAARVRGESAPARSRATRSLQPQEDGLAFDALPRRPHACS